MTNEQLPIQDLERIIEQHHQHRDNHTFSEHSKCPNSAKPHEEKVNVGDIVYLHSDGNKHVVRLRYLLTGTDSEWCYIRKFAGRQLRNMSYRVKRSECFKVKSDFRSSMPNPTEEDDEALQDDDIDISQTTSKKTNQYIPPVIGNIEPYVALPPIQDTGSVTEITNTPPENIQTEQGDTANMTELVLDLSPTMVTP